MAQNRKPPAYQEYAATTLADRSFRLMSLAERGLYYSIRLECWLNGNVPAEASQLAKYLGYEFNEVFEALTERVKILFELKGENLICLELEDYRQHLEDRRKKQSEGGKKGAQKVNANHRLSSSNLQLPRQVTRESLVQSSIEKQSQEQSLDKDDSIANTEWINDYDRQSNG